MTINTKGFNKWTINHLKDQEMLRAYLELTTEDFIRDNNKELLKHSLEMILEALKETNNE